MMNLKEMVEKGKDTCPLCAYLDYFLKNPVPKPEIKPPIETRFLDDEKLVDDLYKLVINEAPTVPIEFFTNEKCAKDIIRLIVNNVNVKEVEDDNTNLVDKLYDNVVAATNLPSEFLRDDKPIKEFIGAIVDTVKEIDLD